ncbi:MAG: hypothetical protein HFG67_03805 [Firmicutes bacterium]|nr:hypothetical protein [Bacillota bacterium]
MRLLTILTGILSILTAIWCFANQGAVFASVAFIIGIIMIVQGICEVCGYFYARSKMGHAAYVLAEGASDFILGILVLANRLDTEVTVPVFFGMWILYSGAMRIATAVNNRKHGGKTWQYIIAVGSASIIAGIYCFFNSLFAGVSSVMLLSICFIIKGMDIIATGIEMPRKRRVRNEKAVRTIELLNIEKKQKEKYKAEKALKQEQQAALAMVIEPEIMKKEDVYGSGVHTTEFDWSELIKQGISIEEKEALDAAKLQSVPSTEEKRDTETESIMEMPVVAFEAADKEEKMQITADKTSEQKPEESSAYDESRNESEGGSVKEAEDENNEEARKEKFIRETLGSLFDINDEKSGENEGQVSFSFISPAREEAEKAIREREEKRKNNIREDSDIINDSIEERISRESKQIRFSWMKSDDSKDQ